LWFLVCSSTSSEQRGGLGGSRRKRREWCPHRVLSGLLSAERRGEGARWSWRWALDKADGRLTPHFARTLVLEQCSPARGCLWGPPDSKSDILRTAPEASAHGKAPLRGQSDLGRGTPSHKRSRLSSPWVALEVLCVSPWKCIFL
jgi:hypothetical protein